MSHAITSREFSSVITSVPEARSWAVDQLHRLGVSEPVSERFRLLISEVATNVVRHTRSPRFTVRLDIEAMIAPSARQDIPVDGPQAGAIMPGPIEAAVLDDDPAAPAPRTAGPADCGGRGLLLVDSMADEWGTRAVRAGKWVWFRIDPKSWPAPTVLAS